MLVKNSPDAETRRAVWSQICLDYYQPAIAFARRRMGNTDDAFVIVQDSAVRLLRLLPDFSLIDDQYNYWIKIVDNRCTDVSTEKAKYAARTVSLVTPHFDDDDNELLPLDPPDRGRDPEMDAEINEKTAILLRELEFHCADLTERERALAKLHFEGDNNEQIASAWGEDVKIIRVDMNAILVKIRCRLKPRRGKQKGAGQSSTRANH